MYRRPELLERRERWGGGKTNAQTISLTPLSDEDTARLVGGLLDQSLLPAEVQQTLLEQAGGNPLYAQEYVRMLQDREVLVREAGGWALAGDIVELPESLNGIIAARLDTLGRRREGVDPGRRRWSGRRPGSARSARSSERSAWQAEELLHGLERKQLVQRVQAQLDPGRDRVPVRSRADPGCRVLARSAAPTAPRSTRLRPCGSNSSPVSGTTRPSCWQTTTRRRCHCARRWERRPRDRCSARGGVHRGCPSGRRDLRHIAAARQYEAALALTQPSDARKHAMLLLGQATALFNAETATPEILQAAIDAQVTVEDWEPPLKPSGCSAGGISIGG